MMKHPYDLNRAELERLADTVQRCLYFDENTGRFDPEHEWSGTDVCEALAFVLSDLGMVPDLKTEDCEEAVYSRVWKCSECGKAARVSYEALAESGTPYCADCEQEMTLLGPNVTLDDVAPEGEFRIKYVCPSCNHVWEETWSCACDSECPNCGAENIQAEDYEQLS